MTAITVERIKLFSTRSPYWCLLLILVACLGLATLIGLIEHGDQATVFTSQAGLNLGMMIFMVLSALAVTTEYRFSTIKATFLAEPNRTLVLVAKTVLLAVLGAVVGAIGSLAAFYLTKLLASSPREALALNNAEDWRVTVGHAALYAIAAIIAVAIGTLVRQSAGAIAIVLVWALVLENLLSAIPALTKASQWFPFSAGGRFVQPSSDDPISQFLVQQGPTPIQGLLVFAGTGALLWVAALVVLRRRDA
jgi:ABC-2 type transport system permease protein